MSAKCQFIHSYGKHKDETCDRGALVHGYCKIHEKYKNGTCKVGITQGQRKNEPCGRPCHEEGASCCEKHMRIAHLLDIPTGLKKCSKHRCITLILETDKYCSVCRELKEEQSKSIRKCQGIIAQNERKGQPCLFEAEDGSNYCGKHRDRGYLREHAKSLGMNVCGDGARCENFVKDAKRCEECLAKNCEYDNKRYAEKQMNTSICIDCARPTETFATGMHGQPTRFCSPCYEKLRTVEDNRHRTVGKEAVRNPTLYYSRYAYDALRRNLTFELTYDNFIQIVGRSCYYCGIISEDAYNGVDRVDNCRGYSVENCVAACKMCNYIKSSYSVDDFVEHCRAIWDYTTNKKTNHRRILWHGPTLTTLAEYLRSNARRSKDISFHLTETEYNELKRGDCYLCGRLSTSENMNGIDRVDSNGSYTLENVKPCCYTCNKMKNEFELHAFLECCERIVKKATA